MSPDLTADFHVDVAAIAGLVGEAEEFTIIDLAAFAGEHDNFAARLGAINFSVFGYRASKKFPTSDGAFAPVNFAVK